MRAMKPRSVIKKERTIKEDALALAELVYDIYKDNQNSDKVVDGQNNAQQITNS